MTLFEYVNISASTFEYFRLEKKCCFLIILGLVYLVTVLNVVYAIEYNV